MIHDFDAEDDHDHHPFPIIQVNAIAVVLVNSQDVQLLLSLCIWSLKMNIFS